MAMPAEGQIMFSTRSVPVGGSRAFPTKKYNNPKPAANARRWFDGSLKLDFSWLLMLKLILMLPLRLFPIPSHVNPNSRFGQLW